MAATESKPFLLAVMGPTASGKTALAESIAAATSACLINADAFQVYRGLNIGTGKPKNSENYRLIDIKDPAETYGVGEFVLDASAILRDCFDRGQNAVVVGGTGLNIRALFEEYKDMKGAPDPEFREQLNCKEDLGTMIVELRKQQPDLRIDWTNPVRVKRAFERLMCQTEPIQFQLPSFRKAKVSLNVQVDQLNHAIDNRVDEMMREGWLDEVKSLLDQGVECTMPAMRAIGYISLANVCLGNYLADDAVEEIKVLTRGYAKRQRTWLRSEPNLTEISELDQNKRVESVLRIISDCERLNQQELI